MVVNLVRDIPPFTGTPFFFQLVIVRAIVPETPGPTTISFTFNLVVDL